MRQCAISSQSPKIGKMNTHSQKMTVNHCKKRYAFDKSFNPLSRGVSLFSDLPRLVRDLPRTHLNARVHRDRDVHPLTRP